MEEDMPILVHVYLIFNKRNNTHGEYERLFGKQVS